MRTGPKPKPKVAPKPKRVNPDAQERLTQEFEALAIIARRAREAFEREGVVVEGSKGSPVLSPQTRVYQFALGQMRMLASTLDPDAVLKFEDDDE